MAGNEPGGMSGSRAFEEKRTGRRPTAGPARPVDSAHGAGAAEQGAGMDPRLRQLALGAGGVFSRSDALALAVTDNDLRALCREHAVRAGHGGYVLRDSWEAASAEGQYALTARAIARSLGNRVTVSHQAALAVHGLPLFGVDTDMVDLLDTATRARSRGRVRRHPDDGSAVRQSNGIRVVSLECALVQTALTSGIGATVSGDAALNRNLVTLDRLRAEVARRTGPIRATEGALHADRAVPPEASPPDGTRQSGEAGAASSTTTALASSAPRRKAGPRARPKDRAKLELWLNTLEPVTESVGETRARLLLLDLGFEVRPQVRILDGHGKVVARVDFLVGRTVVEFDGMVKYEGADGRQALAREKRREETLRRLGFGIVRLIWSDLDDPALVRHRLIQAGARPGARPAA